MRSSLRLPHVVLAVALAMSAAVTPAQPACGSSAGLVPIIDLGTGLYLGMRGGFYGGGSNTVPAAHLAGGLAQAAQLTPIPGVPGPCTAPRIGVLALGMSVASQTFNAFKAASDADPARNPAVVLVNGCIGGALSMSWADPGSNYWTFADQRVTASGLLPSQIQVVWMEMIGEYAGAFAAAQAAFTADLKAIAQIVRTRYPATKLLFVSAIHFLGYSISPSCFKQEPYAYETGFGTRGLVLAQIQGDPNLAYAGAAAAAPWIDWASYAWANGAAPNGQGLTWLPADFNPDGLHFSPAGAAKAGQLLVTTFTTHPAITPWYFGAAPVPKPALANAYGQGCAGSGATAPYVSTAMTGAGGVNLPLAIPWLGNATFKAACFGITGAGPAWLWFSLSNAGTPVPIGGTCNAWIDPAGLLPPIAVPVTGGVATADLPIPCAPPLQDLEVFGQWLVADSGAPLGFAFSNALALRLGAR